jgi:hypothetical protein
MNISKTLLLSLVSSLLAASVYASPVPAEKIPWEKIKETDDGITVFRREIPGAEVLAFRGIGVIDTAKDRLHHHRHDAGQGMDRGSRILERCPVARAG